MPSERRFIGTLGSNDANHPSQIQTTAQTNCCCVDPKQRLNLRSSDLGLSLLGALGWLALPKCPLCLAAYLAIGTGLSISASNSRILYLALGAVAVCLFIAGALRLAIAAWNRRRCNSAAQPSITSIAVLRDDSRSHSR
jgi:hypothetical protein